MNYQEYLEGIKRKLDAMNKQAGIDPAKMRNRKRDPDSIDMANALGASALKYMEEQKLKRDSGK